MGVFSLSYRNLSRNVAYIMRVVSPQSHNSGYIRSFCPCFGIFERMNTPFQPISRRSFHTTGAGFATASIASSLAPNLLANDAVEPWPEFSFIIVSDTHVGRSGQSAEKQWRKTAEELNSAKGDFVLHLGDVVNAGLVEQYPIYQRIRETIGKAVHEIPGNHDPIADFEKQLGKKADRSFDHKGVRFILLNNSRRDSHNGFVTEQQLRWLSEQLTEAAMRKLRVVIGAHVPFHYNRPPDRAWYVKPKDGQTDFYELIDQHRIRVLAVFHGHFHNGIRGWRDRGQLHEVLMPSALYNQNRGLTQKQAPGYNLDEFRPGYVIASFSQGQLRLQYEVTGVKDAAATKELSLG